MGGKFDKSFNEAAFNGAERWKKESGKTYREFEITNASQREQALRRFARDGNNPIVVLGFAYEDALKAVAKDFPKTHFAIVDTVVDMVILFAGALEQMFKPQLARLFGVLQRPRRKAVA